MIIVGAGLSGLIAGNLLSHHPLTVLERQREIPNNHHAVLRFRSTHLSNALRMPFNRVSLLKTILPWKNPVADALAYADKTTGSLRSDRSINKDNNVIVDRYIAPLNLIEHLAHPLKSRIELGVDGFKTISTAPAQPIISTIPMPVLMKQLDYRKKIDFKSVEGWALNATINNCDAYVSIIVPSPDIPFYRISITGASLIIEGTGDPPSYHSPIIDLATDLLGIDPIRLDNPRMEIQRYAKILPIDEDERKRFLAWATDNFGIYSLGRFATWRPSLLLDDLVNDIRLIERWATASDRYHLNQART